MDEPPSDDGAVNATDSCPLPAVMLVIVGAPAVVRGVARVLPVAVPSPAAAPLFALGLLGLGLAGRRRA